MPKKMGFSSMGGGVPTRLRKNRFSSERRRRSEKIASNKKWVPREASRCDLSKYAIKIEIPWLVREYDVVQAIFKILAPP